MDNQKLKTLQQKKDEIDSKIKRIQKQQRAQQTELNNRRKILIGSYYLEQIKRSNSMPELLQTMQQFLIKDEDKKLFTEEGIKKLIK